MFDFIIKLALKYRAIVLILYLVTIIAGFISLSKLPVDVLPDLNRPRVTVFAEAEGLGTQEVEQIVSMPLERTFVTIPGVAEVRSSSALGLSVVNIEFDRGTESNINRQQVYERVQTLGLPEGVHITIAPETTLMGDIIWIGLTSNDESITQTHLRGIAEGTIRQTLSNVQGIANLLIMGGTPKQYNVLLDPVKMVGNHIEISEVESALKDITMPAGGGIVLQPTTEYPVSIKPISGSIQSLGSLIVAKNETGQKILLGDIARITEGSNTQRRGDALIDGKPGVIIRISKIPTANTLVLTEKIDQQLASIESALPQGVTLHKELFRQANFINKGLSNVKKTLIEAMLIVAVVIAMFLMNIRTTIIVMLSLPITFLLTAVIFYLFGIGINIMILGGLTIAIGELVDDSIVDMENIYRRLKQNYLRPKNLQKSLWSIIYRASQEVRGSVIFATILQMIVFIPFLMLPGIDGKLLAPIGTAYMISLLISLVVALTFVPAVCSYILPNRIQRKYMKKYPTLQNDREQEEDNKREERITAIIEEEEDTWLTKKLKGLAIYPIQWSLRNPKKALLYALLTLPITFFLYSNLQKEGLPSFNETSFTVGIVTKPGSSLEYTKNITEQFMGKVKLIEGVKDTSVIIGRADADAHAQGSNNGELNIELGIEVSNSEKARIYDDINAVIQEFKQYAVISIGQPITHRVEEIVSGIRAPLVLKLYGDNLDKIEELGKEIVKRIEKVPGVLNPSLEPQTKVPSISAVPNTINQSFYGISHNTVKEVLEVGIGGREVSQITDGQLRYPVVMSYDTPWKGSIQALSSLPLLSNDGQQITLGTLTTLEEGKARNMINHDNGQRRIVIQGFTQDRGIVDVVEDIKVSLSDLELPTGYSISYEGLYKAQKESSFLLALVTVFVLFAVCFVLYLHFKSRKTVAQLLLDILTGWLGGMIGVWLSGGILSTAHLVGFIALMGIVSRNGIMLIDHYKHLHFVEGLPWNKQTIIKGSLERVVPVTMTALSAILGLLPLVIGAKNTGNEILAPIAIVIFWGLLVSTAIELFIRPGIFLHFNKVLISDDQNKKDAINFD